MHDVGKRLDQERVDVFREAVGDEEQEDQGDKAVDQALAQLDQMLQQRHLVVVQACPGGQVVVLIAGFAVVGHGARLCLLAVAGSRRGCRGGGFRRGHRRCRGLGGC